MHQCDFIVGVGIFYAFSPIVVTALIATTVITVFLFMCIIIIIVNDFFVSVEGVSVHTSKSAGL